MVVRTPVEIKPDERKQLVERELANFMKRENEFIARERQERAAQLGLALYSLRRDTTPGCIVTPLTVEKSVTVAGDRPGE
jgi:hypothetical protein